MKTKIYFFIFLLVVHTKAFSYINNIGLAAAAVDMQKCNIAVSLQGDISPNKAENAWLGNYKIGFETYGALKLEGVELGKKYIFAIPCHNTYIRLHFDYATQPFVGQLRVIIEYQNKKMVVSLSVEDCNENLVSEYQLCTGVKEKLINNITLR